MAKELNLYQSATGRLRVSRMGALTVLVVDGQGMGLTPTADFAAIEKWAKSKQAGPNATIDLGKIMDKVEVLVCRPGTSFGSTRGSIKPLSAVLKEMKASGMDPKEYSLPPELKDDYVSPEEREKERKAKEAKAANATNAGTNAS